jgi:hypothetical protein
MEVLIFIASTVFFWMLSNMVKFQTRASQLKFPSLWAVPFVGNVQLYKLMLSKGEFFQFFFQC